MKNKLTEILKSLHFVICIFAVSYTAQMYFLRSDFQAPWTCMISLFPLLLASDILYRLSRKMWIYIVLQIVLLVGFVSLAGDYRIGYIFAFIICVICQLEDKKNDGLALMEPSWPFVAVIAVLYVVGLASGRPYISDMALLAIMVYIIIALLYLNLVGMEEFMQVRQNVQNVSFTQMNRANTVFMSAVVGLIMVVFLIGNLFVSNSPIYWLFGKLSLIMEKIMRYVIGHSLKGETEAPEALPVPEDGGEAPDALDPIDVSILNKLIYVVGIVLMLAVALAILRLIYIAIKNIMGNFAKRKPVIVEEDYILNEVTDIDPAQYKAEKLRVKVETDRVRIKYKKAVMRVRRKYKLEEPDKSWTPTELEKDTFSKEPFEGLKELHEEYEKARYG